MKLNTRLVKTAAALVLIGLILLIGGGAYLVVAHERSAVLPAPSGTYRVGRVEYDWLDAGRIDPLAAKPNTQRRLAIWIWYPASVTAGSSPAPLLSAAWQRAQDAHGLQRLSPNALLGSLLSAKTPRSHSYAGAPVAASSRAFPVLLMQPGLGPAIPDYTVYAENLASHGYVVVGINETYSSNLVVFADGTVARATPAGSIADNASEANVERQTNAIGQVWAADAGFVLDRLRQVNDDAASPFYQRLDLSRVGLFGHSFGGATALADCQRDPRCKAGANLDGTPISDTRGIAVPRPFLFLTESFPKGCAADKNCRPLQQAYQQAGGPAYFVSISGAKHFNFSDVPLSFTAPGRLVLRLTGATGIISPERGLAISNAYLVAFFDTYVKGAPSPLLSAPRTFPEVQVSSKP